MSTSTLPQHFVERWDTSWKMLLQRTQPRLFPRVSMTDVGGDKKWFNIGSSLEWEKKTGRYQTTTYQDFTTSKAWLVPEVYKCVVLEDKWDESFLHDITSPTSHIIRNHVAGFTRLRDRVIRDAIQGKRITGETGSTEETFPSDNVIAVDYDDGSTDTGLTWDKVKHAIRLLDDLEVDPMGRIFAIGPAQKQDLMSMAEATDRDYANTMLIKNGVIHGTEWAGFTWVESTGLSFDASDADARQCLVWHPDFIEYGESGFSTRIAELPERDYALQIFSDAKIGACRTQNASLIVKCLEA